MTKTKKLKKKRAMQGKRATKPRALPKAPKLTARLQRDIETARRAAAITQAAKPAASASSPQKRRGPTSVRFNADDLALLNMLKDRWKTEGPTATLRKAMEIAEQAVTCTFVPAGD
jgi:hypothetical protein